MKRMMFLPILGVATLMAYGEAPTTAPATSKVIIYVAGRNIPKGTPLDVKDFVEYGLPDTLVAREIEQESYTPKDPPKWGQPAPVEFLKSMILEKKHFTASTTTAPATAPKN